MSQLLRSYFFSDLHLFARRSSASTITPQIYRAADQAHTIILGGDIFDFHWSTWPTLERSIDESIGWLEELVDRFPHCNFHFLLGNHDSHPKFVAELDRLAFRKPRLNWQPYLLRIMNCVFLHGDIVDCEPTHDDLCARRKLGEDRSPPSRSRHWLYDVIVHARLHRAAVNLAVRQATVLKKLTLYLEVQGLDASQGVEHVYFGHTHRDVNGVELHGLTFHNGGASIKGLSFRIIETQLPRSQPCEAHVRPPASKTRNEVNP
jgi:UDP-2,3-diacylglucosamine pyrophosphatase LpxH